MRLCQSLSIPLEIRHFLAKRLNQSELCLILLLKAICLGAGQSSCVNLAQICFVCEFENLLPQPLISLLKHTELVRGVFQLGLLDGNRAFGHFGDSQFIFK